MDERTNHADPATEENRQTPRDPSYIRCAAWLGLILMAVICSYLLSLGLVMRYYKREHLRPRPGDAMITFKSTVAVGDHARRSVHVPSWVPRFYSPAFRLVRSETGLGRAYGDYLFRLMDQKGRCLKNLRELNDAKQKWARDTNKAIGAVPFADHIADYLPTRKIPTCPVGGEYRINPVGDKPECSLHGG